MSITVSSPSTAPIRFVKFSLSIKDATAEPSPFIVLITTKLRADLTEMTDSLKMVMYLFEITCSSEPTKQYLYLPELERILVRPSSLISREIVAWVISKFAFLSSLANSSFNFFCRNKFKNFRLSSASCHKHLLKSLHPFILKACSRYE